KLSDDGSRKKSRSVRQGINSIFARQRGLSRGRLSTYTGKSAVCKDAAGKGAAGKRRTFAGRAVGEYPSGIGVPRSSEHAVSVCRSTRSSSKCSDFFITICQSTDADETT